MSTLLPGTDEWESKNLRRATLIGKQISGTLSFLEWVRLEWLQQEMADALERVCPRNRSYPTHQDILDLRTHIECSLIRKRLEGEP